ncbi:MAG: DSD1 family PLP-dependent enzyme [Burkholderiales bacterium]|nr:DSD1 family PLP-dependent enzyme [Burkholderiales bacterium]
MNPTTLSRYSTPAALLDTARMQRNIDTMQSRLNALNVKLRPHVKTSKCVEVVRRQIDAGASGITVSTLKEAEQFFAAGIRDILYAVGMVAVKLPQAKALRDRGCDLKIIVDSVDAAQAVADFGRTQGHVLEVWLEVDTDGHRAGLKPDGGELIAVGRALHQGGMTLGGVMTHAGASYELNTPAALAAMAEQERSRCVLAAERLRAAGLPCANVSVGSTPTALSAQRLDGVTEVRAGVYVFHDLVMTNIGVARLDDLALSVLTTVIGHQKEKGWALVDAGWMAMSRDRGTQKQMHDYGYGQVCDVNGVPVEGYIVDSANQEHGIVARAGCVDGDIAGRFPVGTQLRILPNHACATAAQFAEYVAVDSASGGAVAIWPRFGGW